MDEILMSEKFDIPVTYGELITILESLMEELVEDDSDVILKIADKLSDYMVKIRDDADYKRQRDLRFMINLIAQICKYDKEILYTEYQRWCTEFDKLNKSQNKDDSKDE